MEQISDQTAVAIQEDAVVVGDRLRGSNLGPRKFVVEEYEAFNFFTCKETTRYVYSSHLSKYELVIAILMVIFLVIATPLSLIVTAPYLYYIHKVRENELSVCGNI